MKIFHFIVLISFLGLFSHCDKKEVVQPTQFNFPVNQTIDAGLYAEIKKTCQSHWDMNQMIDTSFRVEKDGLEYVIRCDGYLNGGYYNFEILADENGKWISDSQNFVLTKSYDYESWPGKDGLVKTDIEFPSQLVSKYNLSLEPDYSGDDFTYQIALNSTDTLKTGRIAVNVFSDIAEAQSSLVGYIEGLTTPLPLLSVQHIKAGDVAFGKVSDGILNLAWVRNNVMVVIQAPSGVGQAIDLAIDQKIQSAPEWTEGLSYPSYVGFNQ
ncbi:MAG TPA: hypothetical protein DCL77_21325 [Prolixibacteraceae bacterium]|jgi:hypothetical protein|nr:hypothetical protein [Prolixibacteraceae bacterium]